MQRILFLFSILLLCSRVHSQDINFYYDKTNQNLLNKDTLESLIRHNSQISFHDTLTKTCALSKIAKVYYLYGNYDIALFYLDSVGKLLQPTQKHSLLADYYSNLASVYYFSQYCEYDTIITLFKQAEQLYYSSKNNKSALLCRNFSAYVYWAKGDKDSARIIHKSVYTEAKNINFKRGYTIAGSDLGFTLNSLGLYDKALLYNKEALSNAYKLEDTIIAIPILNNIAISYQNLQIIDSAIAYSLKSLEYAKQNKLNLRIKEAYATLHKSYYLHNNYESAYFYLSKYNTISDSIFNIEKAKNFIKQNLRKEFELTKNRLESNIAIQKLQSNKKVNELIYIIALLLVILFTIILFQYKKKKMIEVLYRQNEKLEQANNELKTLRSELIQAEKIQSLKHVIDGIAHEFNNPLNFIKASYYAIHESIYKIQDEVLKHELDQYNEYSLKGLERMSSLIDDIEKYYGLIKSKDKHTLCFPVDIIQEIVNTFKTNVKNIQFAIKNTYNNKITTHKEALTKVLENIISNAVSASKQNSSITISIDESSSKNVVITIHDSGIGIPSDVLAHIFDPFYTTKDPNEGVGLSLYFTYLIVQELQGTIEITSENKNGTTVYIVL